MPFAPRRQKTTRARFVLRAGGDKFIALKEHRHGRDASWQQKF
jgi:hypothetical protein